jgi:hypothetical protein
LLGRTVSPSIEQESLRRQHLPGADRVLRRDDKDAVGALAGVHRERHCVTKVNGATVWKPGT